MPPMKGIDLCRELAGYPVKKIMLTGEANEKFAVGAFNEGTIDGFLSKKEENFSELLGRVIANAQKNILKQHTLLYWKI